MPLHKLFEIFNSAGKETSICKILTWFIPYGLVARIPGFHPGGSGSIPGMGSCVSEEQRCVAFH